MSSQYNIEPPPKGQCVLHTTSGDIFLELFAQQTPLASRNFLQLILDGYYSNTIFHRLVPGFILQGGDPSGTGSGGESAYDGGLPFADEFHSRLKFNRRGLLGMANGGAKDDNSSQFFLTLGPAEELNGKHTMFGRVAGNTIFNLVKMGEAELVDRDGSERPLYPTKITGADILENPFDDMKPRLGDSRKSIAVAEQSKKGPRKKITKNKLSFAADDDIDISPALPPSKRLKYNTELVSGASHVDKTHQPSQTLINPENHEVSTSQEGRLPARTDMQATSQAITTETTPLKSDGQVKPSAVSEIRPKMSSLEQTNAKIAELRASLKRNIVAAQPQVPVKKSLLESMIPSTSTKGRKRGTVAISSVDEKRNLCAFNAFKEKLGKLETTRSLPPGKAEDGPETTLAASKALSMSEPASQHSLNGSALQEDEASLCDLHFIANCQSCTKWDDEADLGIAHDEEGTDWMTHTLSFAKDRLGKDIEWKRKNEEELVVIDPREKAKDIAGKSQRHSNSRRTDR